MRAPFLVVLAVLAVPSVLRLPAAAQTGTWTIAVRPSSGGTAAYAAEAGHATTADSATSATTAASLAADPTPCPPGQYVADLSAAGILTCSTPPAGTGDVVGPATAPDKAVPRYGGTTGKLLQSSQVTITDAGGINTGTVAGTGNIALRAWSGYNDGSKPISVGNSGVGEIFNLDSIGSAYFRSGVAIQGVSSPATVWLLGTGQGLIELSNSGALRWSATANATQGYDTGLTRPAPGVVKIENVLGLTPIANAPACDAAGRIYHDTAPALCWCNGTAWVVVAGAGPCA